MRTVPGHLSLHTDKDFPWPPVTIHRQGCPRALVTTTCMDCPRTLVNTICTTIPGSLSLHTDKDCPRTLVTICMDCPRMPVTTIYKDFPRMPVTSHLVTCHYTQTRTVPGHLSLHTDKDCPWSPVSTHKQGLSLATCLYTQTRTVPDHLSLHTDKDCPWSPVTTHGQGLCHRRASFGCQAPRWNLGPQAHPQLQYIVWFLGASVSSLLM